MLQVNYGLLSDARGCPVAISVHAGSVADGTTLLSEEERVRERFGIEKVVMVGDRGMIGHTTISKLHKTLGIDWITTLKYGPLRILAEQGNLQPDVFDERALVEFTAPDYPGERLVACRNPQRAGLRAHKRQDLLGATATNL
jgi:hypothetical protein